LTNNIVSLVPDAEGEVPSTLEEVLTKMQEAREVEEGVIVALHKEGGGLVVASNLPNLATINMLLDTAKLNLLTGQGAE